MKNTVVSFLLLLSLVVASSCKKEKEVVYVKDEILNGQSETSWMLNLIKVNGQELTNRHVDSCAKDDILIFKSDMTFRVEENVAVCDSSKTTTVKRVGLWDVSEHQDTLYLLPTDNSTTIKAKIVDVASTRIIYKYYIGEDEFEYTYLLK